MVKFKIKFIQKNMCLCLEQLEKVIELCPRVIGLGMNSMGMRKVDPLFNTIDENDRDNIVVSSKKLKPIIFYLDGNFLRCSNTDKYLCCFSPNRQCGGGSPMFLSDNKNAAIYFDSNNLKNILTNKKENVFWFNKSRVYPRECYPGKGAVIPGGGGLLECGPMICYHNPNIPQRWVISPQHMIKLEIVQ
tara:strand:+ start:2374 stop:2940 length:567 start_codon:yes stop_codon:yes gene_type:complete